MITFRYPATAGLPRGRRPKGATAGPHGKPPCYRPGAFAGAILRTLQRRAALGLPLHNRDGSVTDPRTGLAVWRPPG